MKAYLALLQSDFRLAMRNRAVIFFNYFFPLAFFFLFAFMMDAKQGAMINRVVTMVLVLGILGNGLYGAGMRAVMDRENDVLRRYKVTPITPMPLLFASIATGVLLYIPTIAATLFLAHRFFGMAVPDNLLSFTLFALVGAAAFRAIGLIVAAVVNSSQESNILIQPLYMVMLFLSGLTIPITYFPDWLQRVAQFIPATYLVTGLAGILQRNENALQNWLPILALVLTTIIGIFIASKLFRWEKEEKLRASAKLWVLVTLVPFLFLGAYQAWSSENVAKSKMLTRDLKRGQSSLIANARIFVGNGKIIETGSVLVRKGKIERVFEGPAPDAKSLNAELIEAAGKTILPGLIDVHVHLGATGGFYKDWSTFDANKAIERELRAYLYCGVTAVRSAGDAVDTVIKLRRPYQTGEKLGTELFLCGPLFTAEGGHGTEYGKFLPEGLRENFVAQFVRTPQSAEEATRQVDDLATKGVNAIKGVLEAGAPSHPFNRMRVDLLAAVATEARAKNLPVAVHTGSAQDVADAISVGANSVEHGSFSEGIPDASFALMKEKGVVLDPTLTVVEGFKNFSAGKNDALKRSLIQQVTPKNLLDDTADALQNAETAELRTNIGRYPMSTETGAKNLLRAWQAGVTLVTGSDAGNFLNFHGPTVQREVELWLEAGIPVEVALQAATLNAAKLLRADDRIGSIEEGKEATLIVVDGNPLQDVRALSSLSMVMLKGERVARAELLENK